MYSDSQLSTAVDATYVEAFLPGKRGAGTVCGKPGCHSVCPSFRCKTFPSSDSIISQRRPSSPVTKLSFGITGLIVEDHIEEGAGDVYTAVVLNEAELAEPI